MSLRSDGTYRCDRCGADVGNASVQACAVVSDLDPHDPARPRVLHLCRKPQKGAPHGCARNVLGTGTLADLTGMES